MTSEAKERMKGKRRVTVQPRRKRQSLRRKKKKDQTRESLPEACRNSEGSQGGEGEKGFKEEVAGSPFLGQLNIKERRKHTSTSTQHMNFLYFYL